MEPDDENLDVMGQALLLSGDRQAALPFFQRAIEQSPDYAPALLHMGIAYLDLGQNDLAYPLLEKARSLDPGSATSEQAASLLEYFFR
jgi:tetratricopeptide (TPR) repeat protein